MEIKIQVWCRGELFGYERLIEKGWEWMCIPLNPEGGERWVPGIMGTSEVYKRRLFTGLTDKHGVEIYEGDIVVTPKGICTVTFERGCFYTIEVDQPGKPKCEYWIQKTNAYGKAPRERCSKEAVITDDHGRNLCQHHYNRWKAKVDKHLTTKPTP